MTTIKSFTDLKVWQLSHDLTLDIYRITRSFPKEELYGITSQIRRSVSSIPSNIAEGKGRLTTKEYIRFLTIAAGSLEESKYFLILSKDLGYIGLAIYTRLYGIMETIGRMLFKMRNSLTALSKV